MKSFLSSSLGLAALLSAVLPAPSAHAQSTPPPSPYLEVVSLTFLWNTVDTYITRTTVPAGTSPGTGLDPTLYDPTKPISVETGSLGVLNTDGINQDVLVRHLSQALIRSKFPLTLEYGEGPVPTEIEQGERLPYIYRKEALGADFQILAVREAPRTIAEFATKPYTIYLSAIDRTSGYWSLPQISSIPVDPYGYERAPDIQGDLISTGLTLELGQWSASGTIAEKLSSSSEDAVLTGASGKITVAFKLKYGAAFYDDPRHNAKDDAEIHEYHLKRHLWNIEGSGHLVFNLGSVNSPSSATIPGGVAKITGASLTGTGWFDLTSTTVEIKDEAIYRIFYSGADGLAPVRIVMNNFQYQNRNMFAYYPPRPLYVAPPIELPEEEE